MGFSASSTNSFNTNARQRDLGAVLKELNMSDRDFNAEVFVERIITDSLKIKFSIARNDRSGSIDGFGSGSKSTITNKVSLVYYF